MLFEVGDLVEYRTTGAVGAPIVNKNVVVTSLDSFVGWVEVFDGSKAVAVPLYSLSRLGE